MDLSILNDKRLRSRFSNYAKGTGLRFAEECQHAKEIILASEKLQLCDPDSVFNAILNVAMTGLSLNKTNAEAYLTPRLCKTIVDGKEIKRWQCVLIPGYRGLIKLANKSGAVINVDADVVYEKDTFDLETGTSPKLKHKPFIFGPRGNKLLAYCVTTLANGQKSITYMTAEEIAKVQAAAETQMVWKGPFQDEMWKKSAIRRAYKTWPRAMQDDQRLRNSVELLNEYEGIVHPRTAEGPVVESITEEQVQALELVASDFGLPVGTGLSKVLEAYGVQTPASLPADRFGEAKTRLQHYCENVAEKRKETSHADQA